MKFSCLLCLLWLFSQCPQLCIDNLFKRSGGLGAINEDAIDEKCGRSGHTGLDSGLKIFLDARLKFSARDTGIKLLFVETESLRMLLQTTGLQFRWICEQLL